MINMRLFKRKNGYYYASLRRGYEQSLKTKNKVIAEAAFKKIQKAALMGKLVELSKGENIALKDFIDQYVEWSEGVKKAAASIRSDRLSLESLLAHTGNKYLRMITANEQVGGSIPPFGSIEYPTVSTTSEEKT